MVPTKKEGRAKDEEVIKKLEGLGQDMLEQIKAKSTPTFTTALRSKGNIIYDQRSAGS